MLKKPHKSKLNKKPYTIRNKQTRHTQINEQNPQNKTSKLKTQPTKKPKPTKQNTPSGGGYKLVDLGQHGMSSVLLWSILIFVL